MVKQDIRKPSQEVNVMTENTTWAERDRLLRDLEDERAERRRLQERLEERERPWWLRVFGG